MPLIPIAACTALRPAQAALAGQIGEGRGWQDCRSNKPGVPGRSSGQDSRFAFGVLERARGKGTRVERWMEELPS